MDRGYNKYNKPTAPINNGGRKEKTSTGLAVFLTVAAVFIGAVFLYIFISNSTFLSSDRSHSGFGGGGEGSSANVRSISEATPTPAPEPTSTPLPKPTETPVSEPNTIPTYSPSDTPDTSSYGGQISSNQVEQAPSNPLYVRHRNDEYGFSCLFPKHFVVNRADTVSPPYIACSPKGSAQEIMDVKSAFGCSVSSELNMYISSVGGEITYMDQGDDFYAVSMTAGDTCYYKYCKFANGNMYSFEFINPLRQDSIYSRYIETIYQGFTID